MNGGELVATRIRTKEDVLDALLQNRPTIQRLGVRRLGLFGSFARGEQRKDSDIDLIVEFEPGKKTFDNFIGLSLFLEELLEHRIELVTPESLSPYIGPRILKQVEYVSLAA